MKTCHKKRPVYVATLSIAIHYFQPHMYAPLCPLPASVQSLMHLYVDKPARRSSLSYTHRSTDSCLNIHSPCHTHTHGCTHWHTNMHTSIHAYTHARMLFIHTKSPDCLAPGTLTDTTRGRPLPPGCAEAPAERVWERMSGKTCVLNIHKFEEPTHCEFCSDFLRSGFQTHQRCWLFVFVPASSQFG